MFFKAGKMDCAPLFTRANFISNSDVLDIYILSIGCHSQFVDLRALVREERVSLATSRINSTLEPLRACRTFYLDSIYAFCQWLLIYINLQLLALMVDYCHSFHNKCLWIVVSKKKKMPMDCVIMN
jgi:hypothetical protein